MFYPIQSFSRRIQTLNCFYLTDDQNVDSTAKSAEVVRPRPWQCHFKQFKPLTTKTN